MIQALGRVHDLAPDGEVIAVTHGGVVYALEGRLGVPFERLANLGAEVKTGTPAEFGKMLADERALWTGIVKAANIQVE